MNPFHAVVIAGGAGLRLGGVRKAELRIGGQRLLDRVVAALGQVEPPVMIASGPRRDALDARLPAGTVQVPDAGATRAGPLAGLAGAIDALRGRGITEGILVSVAVDTPLLPPDYTGRLLEGLVDAPASFAAWGDDFYPPNAAWRIEAIADLPERMADGTAPASLKRLLLGLDARKVDWKTGGGDNPFANINTLADVLALGRRAKG